MKNGEYSLRYLPQYEKDFNEIVDYISIKLQNPDSAMKLVDKVEKAILERSGYPLSFEPFNSVKKRVHPYYRIYVDNFTIYYVVIENVMEVRRIFYNKRNATKIIR